ncbi:MAG: DUF2752 domain-containing protein [Acidobacteria bacterium]|nr:DUF2752 domain-containing protein [Acidobacteriota bacterium]
MLERWTGRPLETCLFHRVTGRPCPTCGGTRALVALAGGSVLEALGNNPLVTLLLGAGGGLMLLRAFSGRRLSLQFEGRERAAAMALALVALGLNWWWVWRRGL